MTTEPVFAVLMVLRIAGYAGFVLWAGPLVFWTLVWPTGHRHRRLLRLSGVGALLLILTTVAEPAIRLTVGDQPLDEVAPPLAGAAALVRLAILVGSLFYLVDLVGGAVVGRRRAVALAAIVVAAATVAVQPIALGQPGPPLAALGTFGHLLAAAAWLGGLVALATVIRPGGDTGETGGLVTRFSPVATLGLVLLVLASGLTILAGTGVSAFADQREAPVLVLRFGLLAALLVVAWYAHRATARMAFRRLFSPLAVTGPARERTLTLVVGAQLAIAFVALSAAMLVALTA
jgi:putative copper export protein